MPFDLIRDADLGMSVTGNIDGWGDGSTFSGDLIFTTAEWYWIQFWADVEPERQADYAAFVDDCSRSLKELGRYPRPLNNRVTPMMDWVAERNQAGGQLLESSSSGASAPWPHWYPPCGRQASLRSSRRGRSDVVEGLAQPSGSRARLVLRGKGREERESRAGDRDRVA